MLYRAKSALVQTSCIFRSLFDLMINHENNYAVFFFFPVHLI